MKVSKLKLNPQNPRIILDEAFEKLCESIERDPEFMRLRPIIHDGGKILGGNQRYRAIKHLGMKDIPDDWAVEAKDLTDEQKRRFILVDNAPKGMAGGWDVSMLEEHFELPELKDLGFDIEGMGLDLSNSDGTNGLTDPDDVPDPPEEPTAKVGDLYGLGKHRVLCGDATKREDVEQVMAGEMSQLCFTSPPYWVGKEYETQTTLEEVRNFIKVIAENISRAVTADGGRICLNTSTASARAINPKAQVETLFSLTWWQDAFRDCDWLMRHCRLWVKRGQLGAARVAAKTDVIDQHWETVATFLPTFYNPDGLRRGQEKINMKWAQQGVWDDIHGAANMKEHGAAFPVELPLRYMKLYSIGDENVCDPFLGSGTTLIACEKTGRTCFGLEIDPHYVDVTIQRYENFTGNKAELIT